MENMDAYSDLKRSGLKNTKCRTVILDILKKSSQPVTAETIYLSLSENNISVSLSTVYRTLETLADKSLVTKFNITGEDKAYFEYNHLSHKHYLICLGCKKIRPIEHCPLNNYEETVKKETNYDISGHRLDIYGFCPECKKNMEISTKY